MQGQTYEGTVLKIKITKIENDAPKAAN